MKEAAGEANITVITIVLIAIVLAVGTPLVSNLLKNASRSSCCNANGGSWKQGKCFSITQSTGQVSTQQININGVCD